MINKQKKIIIIGATSAIAEHCARLWLQEAAAELILVGRDTAKLKKIAADLNVRSPESIIHVYETNFTDPNSIEQFIAGIYQEGAIDIALIAHGYLPVQLKTQNNLKLVFDVLLIDGLSPVLFAEAFAKYMQQANKGTLALISSVAGERGRKSIYIYGAAKALMNHYVQGLQHRFTNTNVKIVLIKPGPTATPMTAHLPPNSFYLAKVTNVAKLIIRGINEGKAVIYAPKKWAWIMFVVRCLPQVIFNKIKI